MAIRVFEINDVEWWAGDCTPEEMLKFYMDETGVTHEEATGSEDEYPKPLTEEEMDKMKFCDEDNPSVKRTFREELQRMIDGGAKFPSFFATTEF